MGCNPMVRTTPRHPGDLWNGTVWIAPKAIGEPRWHLTAHPAFCPDLCAYAGLTPLRIGSLAVKSKIEVPVRSSSPIDYGNLIAVE